MKFVYMATTGTNDPTKASLPLHLAANGSVEVGHDTTVILAGDATEILLGHNLDQMEGVGVPPARELLAKLRDHSVPVYVGKGCAVARGATDEHLAKVNGRWTTPPEAATLCAEADRALTFGPRPWDRGSASGPLRQADGMQDRRRGSTAADWSHDWDEQLSYAGRSGPEFRRTGDKRPMPRP